jgi:hypothetical protein
MTSNRFKTQGKAVCGHFGEPFGGLFGAFDDVHGPEGITAGIALRARINGLRNAQSDTHRGRRVTQVVGAGRGKESFAEKYAARVAKPSARKCD